MDNATGQSKMEIKAASTESSETGYLVTMFAQILRWKGLRLLNKIKALTTWEISFTLVPVSNVSINHRAVCARKTSCTSCRGYHICVTVKRCYFPGDVHEAMRIYLTG